MVGGDAGGRCGEGKSVDTYLTVVMIHGIGGSSEGARRPDLNGSAAARDATPAVRPSTAAARPASTPQAGVSVQPPPGTDPELWKVLTGDERAFFAKLGAMGPLTYGRVLSGQLPVTPSAPAALGVRLDVKI